MSPIDDDARPIRKGSLANPTQFGYTAQVADNRPSVVVDYEISPACHPTRPASPPPSNGPSRRSVP